MCDSNSCDLSRVTCLIQLYTCMHTRAHDYSYGHIHTRAHAYGHMYADTYETHGYLNMDKHTSTHVMHPWICTCANVCTCMSARAWTACMHTQAHIIIHTGLNVCAGDGRLIFCIILALRFLMPFQQAAMAILAIIHIGVDTTVRTSTNYRPRLFTVVWKMR